MIWPHRILMADKSPFLGGKHHQIGVAKVSLTRAKRRQRPEVCGE